jgi:YD repeat-containing protein
MTADGVSKVSIYQYNSSGQLIMATAPGMDGKKITTLTYDARGNLASVTNALKQSVRFTQYDANGRLLSMSDPRGRSTIFTYDVNGRRTSTTAGALTSRYTYNANGQLDTVLFANGSSIAYDYDNAHRLTDLTDGRVNTIHLTRDLGGRITQRTVIDQNDTTVRSRAFAFDQRGRLQQQSGNNGQMNAYSYDKEGNLLAVFDALNRTSQVQYDALLRTTQSIDAKGNQTLFDYDANNNLAGVTSPRGVMTQYQRNGFGQTVKLTSPDSGKKQYQYDISGNLIALTDARGQITRIGYDVLNRPTLISYADNQQVSLTYDQSQNGIGRLTAIDNRNSGNAYQYDINGRITLQRQKIGTVIEDLQYGYTAIGELISQQYPSGATVQYTYAVDGKIDTLLVNGSPLLSQIQYQADGKIGQWTWGNARIATRNFDTDGRLTGYSKATSNATIAYDNANRIINLADTSSTALTQGFAYDLNDSLTHYAGNAITQSYQYDADGNRTAQVASTTTSYLYATNSNHLTQLKGARTEQFKYDAVGNIVNDATNSYRYDASNRLVKVSNRAGSTSYLFNPLGQRVAKLTGGQQDDDKHGFDEHDDGKTNGTYFTYDAAGRLIGEYNRNRSQSTEYVWMGNSPVAVLKKNGGDPAKLYTIHTDHLGTPRR